MRLIQRPNSGAVVPKRKIDQFLRGLIVTVIISGIFTLGFLFGSGKLKVNLFESTPVAINQSLPEDLDYSSVEEVYDTLRRNYDGEIKHENLIDGLKKGLVEAVGDPHTEYFNAESASQFNQDLNGQFSGIGAELNREDNLIVVVAPIEGFPADKAGLLPKDTIATIDGQNTYSMTLSEAVDRIRGPAGTVVKLGVIRGEEDLEFNITREEITIPSVKFEIKDNNTGYIRVGRFSEDTVELFEAAATNLKSSKVDGIIVDLRGNPGGLLEASIQISDMWVGDNQLILQERRDDIIIESVRGSSDDLLAGIPTVVLIDEGSASASEIVAGALKDHKLATLVGQKTFGKGSVQTLEELSADTLLKVTFARWYTPAGRNIDKEGIEPDINVEVTREDIDTGKDPQLEAALKQLSN